MYKRQKALIAEDEIERHFFIKEEEGEELAEESLLRGYQTLCRTVDKPIHDSVFCCLQELKRAPFINIVNLIDSVRTDTRPLVFKTFAEFKRYTQESGNMINRWMAKQG